MKMNNLQLIFFQLEHRLPGTKVAAFVRMIVSVMIMLSPSEMISKATNGQTGISSLSCRFGKRFSKWAILVYFSKNNRIVIKNAEYFRKCEEVFEYLQILQTATFIPFDF